MRFIPQALIIALVSLTVESYSQIQFIENKGQWPREVRFKAEMAAGNIYLMDDGILYDLFFMTYSDYNGHGHPHHLPEVIKHHVIKASFVNNNARAVRSKGINRSLGKFNYYLGDDPENWALDVHAFKEVVFYDVFEKTDLRFYSEGGKFKYDIHLNKGAKAKNVKFRYEGAGGLELSPSGLLIKNTISALTEEIPMAYTIRHGKRTQVQARHEVSNNTVSFWLPSGKSREEEMIIDPLLIFSTYSGSTSDNWGFTAAFDDLGNAYSGGIAFGAGFPTTLGAFDESFNGGSVDIAILKYDSLGENILYATYLGGNSAEVPHSLVVNNNRELILLGTTSSTNFPTSVNALQRNFAGGVPLFGGLPVPGGYENGSDLVIAKICENGGQLLASTFLGGTDNDGINIQGDPLVKNYGDQFRGDIITDSLGFIYVASSSRSSDFPVKNAFQEFKTVEEAPDAVIFKIKPDLSELVWSTYYGGLGADAAFSIKLDDSLNVYTAGGTGSRNLQLPLDAAQFIPPGSDNGFGIKLSTDGQQLLGGSYIGAAGEDIVYFLDIDPFGDIYVMGNNQVVPTGGIPILGNVFNNPNSGQFIQKFSNDFTGLLLSTTIGSSQSIKNFSPTAFLVNDCGNLYISGWGSPVFSPPSGNTFGLPITNDAVQTETDGSDFYLMVLEQDMRSLLSATYFGEIGGVGDHVDGGTSRFDPRGIVYQAVCASCGGTQGFPTTEGVVSNNNNSANCNNAVFKFDLASLIAQFETNTPDGLNPGIQSGCEPFTFLFINTSIGGQNFFWDLGDGTTTTQPDSVVHTFEEAGTYEVVLRAEDVNTCKAIDFARKTIQIFEPNFQVQGDTTICAGEQIILQAGGAGTYRWSPALGLNDSTLATPTASPDETTQYKVIAIDENGCVFEDSLVVEVLPGVITDFSLQTRYGCDGKTIFELTNLSENAEEFLWSFGDGNTSSEMNVSYSYPDTVARNYTIELLAANGVCEESKSVEVTDVPIKIPNVITPGDGAFNEYFVVESNTQPRVVITDRWGGKIFKSEAYQNDWNASNSDADVLYYDISFPDGTNCRSWLHVLKAGEN